MLEDLYNVGPDKPMAYETIAELCDRRGMTIDAIKFDMAAKGLKVLVLEDHEAAIYSGAVYVYDEDALITLLNDRKDVLSRHGWPDTPETFIRQAAGQWAPEKTALFDLVADAFGDKEHPGRTDVRVPDHDDRYQPRYLEMLREIERSTAAAAHIGCKPR